MIRAACVLACAAAFAPTRPKLAALSRTTPLSRTDAVSKLTEKEKQEKFWQGDWVPRRRGYESRFRRQKRPTGRTKAKD